ncbi:MAG TPA: hypothetical protein VHM67_05325 [Gemmatimonadaceae bacterium]|nr:hypothetical protein [Gemmatimonadaceae bacterium]
MTRRPIAFVALLAVATSVRAQEAPASPAGLGYHRPRWKWRDASPPRVGMRAFGHGIGVRVGF